MIDLHLSEPVHRMIAAPTGGGKSYFVGFMVEQLYALERHFIILDTKTENHIGLAALPGVTLFRINPRKPIKNMSVFLNTPYALCIPHSRDDDITDIINVYRQIVQYLWLHEDAERIYITEEAHNWNKNASVPDKLFEKIAREGRGYGKYIWFITQRLQNFSQLLWSQCKYTYIFRHNTPTDLRYISQMIPEFQWRGNKQPGLNDDLNDHDVLVYDGKTSSIIRANEIRRKTRHLG